MKSAGITLTLPSGEKLTRLIPDECNQHIVLAAMRLLMRGEEPAVGLTAAESAFVADVHEAIREALAKEETPAKEPSA